MVGEKTLLRISNLSFPELQQTPDVRSLGPDVPEAGEHEDVERDDEAEGYEVAGHEERDLEDGRRVDLVEEPALLYEGKY